MPKSNDAMTSELALTRRALLKLSALAALEGHVFAALREEDRHWAEQTLAKLSPAERVGQLMSVYHSIPGLDDGVRAGKTGSLQVPRGGDTTAKDVIEFINRIQSAARIPLFMMGAVEAGMGQVAKEATLLPNNMAIGATGSEKLAYDAANVTAKEARALGVDWPGVTVADVNSNPANPIINTRSFGDSPELVSRLLVASIRGVQDERLISTANHFPGHGGTSQDSHLELPVVNRTRAELDEIDLPSFVAAIKAGVATMCTAHICYPALEPDPKLPATMSPAILIDLLRTQLGFEGFVHSDSFAMDAIRKNFKIEDAAIQSVRAGCDILLSYPDWDECYQAVLKRAEKDDLLRRRVDESALRILTWKHWVGLPQRKPLDLESGLAVLSDPQHKQTAVEIAQAAVTSVRGDGFWKALPRRKKVVCVVGGQAKPLESPAANVTIQAMLQKSWPAAEIIALDAEPTDSQSQALTTNTAAADAVVFLGFTQVRNHDPDSVRFPKQQSQLIGQLCETRPVGVMCFGSPYALAELKSAAALGCAYDKIHVCLQAGIDALVGKIPWRGKLPVKL